jgi:purine-binding chemotaxis protein CheW
VNEQSHSTFAAAPSSGEAQAGKYLTFCLGSESYGVAVLKIREILRLPEVTPVPRMPDYIRGVVNLRGKIIPVIDLRRRFGMAGDDTGERACIVVVHIVLAGSQPTLMGLVVDGVEEVVNIQQGDLEATPDFGSSALGAQAGYILGMAKVKGRVKTLLDIDKVVSTAALGEIEAEAAALAA